MRTKSNSRLERFFLGYSWNPKLSQACWCLSQGILPFSSRTYFFLNIKLLWTVFMPYFIIFSWFLAHCLSVSYIWDILSSQLLSSTPWPGILSCFRRVNLLLFASLAFLAPLTMAFGAPQLLILGALLLWICPSALILSSWNAQMGFAGCSSRRLGWNESPGGGELPDQGEGQTLTCAYWSSPSVCFTLLVPLEVGGFFLFTKQRFGM